VGDAHILRDAERRHEGAEREVANTGLLHRRSARHAAAATADDVTTARTALDHLIGPSPTSP
jgi:hypothetical protein